jgi:hypothetical protein
LRSHDTCGYKPERRGEGEKRRKRDKEKNKRIHVHRKNLELRI